MKIHLSIIGIVRQPPITLLIQECGSWGGIYFCLFGSFALVCHDEKRRWVAVRGYVCTHPPQTGHWGHVPEFRCKASVHRNFIKHFDGFEFRHLNRANPSLSISSHQAMLVLAAVFSSLHLFTNGPCGLASTWLVS